MAIKYVFNPFTAKFDAVQDPLVLSEQATEPVADADTINVHAHDSQGITVIHASDSTGFTYELGQDTYFIARNTTASPIPKGKCVYVTSDTGVTPNIALARSNSITTLHPSAITAEAIPVNGFGRCFITGVMENIDTSAFNVGERLYVSSTVAGEFTNVPPAYPNYEKKVATVIIKGAGNGKILIRVAATLGSDLSTYIHHGDTQGLGDDDHVQYIINAPTSSTRNIIQPVGDNKALIIKMSASQVTDVFQIQDKDGNELGCFEADGDWNLYGHTLHRMACDNGTSFPASPATAQWFYRTDIKTLFQYEGGWKAIQSFGAVTLYVDNTNGTDASGQGYSATTGATKTIQYAIDLIPPINGGNVTVNITAEAYTESLVVRGKAFTGNYTITLNGTLTQLESFTSATVVAGSGATQGTVTKTGQFTGDSYANKIVYFATDNTYRIIDSHTNDVLTLVGVAASSTTQNCAVYDWGTTAYNISIAIGQTGIVCQNLKFIGTASVFYGVNVGANTNPSFTYCSINKRFFCVKASPLTQDCVYSASVGGAEVDVGYGTLLVSQRTKWFISSNTGYIDIYGAGTFVFRNGSIINGLSGGGVLKADYGAKVRNNGVLLIENVLAQGYVRITNCDVGIGTLVGGQFAMSLGNFSDIQFSGNTTDTTYYYDNGYTQNNSSTETLKVNATSATVIPIVAKGASAQSADLQEWQDSTGAVLSHVNANGTVDIGIATGTAPMTVASTTLVTNLNADMTDGKHVGTSGNTIPLLDGANSWSGLNIFTSGGSIPYGSMYGDDVTLAVTVAATGTYYAVPTGLTTGLVNQFTFANSTLTCGKAGVYKVDWSMTLQCATANQEVSGAVMINTTAQVNTEGATKLTTGNDNKCVAGSGIVTLALNDVVKLCVENETATNNLTVTHASLSLIMVGG